MLLIGPGLSYHGIATLKSVKCPLPVHLQFATDDYQLAKGITI